MTDTNEYGYVIPEDTEENSYIDDTSENEGKENYDDEIAVQAVSLDGRLPVYIDGVLKKIYVGDFYSSDSTATYNAELSTDKKTLTLSFASSSGGWEYGPISLLTITTDKEILYYPTTFKYDNLNYPKFYIWTYKLTDLTDTEWCFNETVVGTAKGDTFRVDFVSNSTNYDDLSIPAGTGDNALIYRNSTSTIYAYVHTTETWEATAYRTISITGGSDAKSTSLIDWLYSNATLISAPEPVTRQFTRLYKGIIPHGQANNKCFKQYSRGLNEFDVAGASSYFPNETSSITWKQWVESEYNTAGYSIDDYGYVLTASPFYGVVDGDFRKGTDFIIEGDSFELDAERIFFRIDGKTYYCFEGYDFEWWVDSNYNTDGFYLDDDNYLNTADGKKVKDTNGDYVYGTAEAEDDTDYYSESVTLISFTINISSNGVDKDYEFQAEEGMTWAEWVESDYNTDGTWTIYSNGYIQKSDTTDHTMRVSASSTVKGTVSATDVIIANHSYTYDNFGA